MLCFAAQMCLGRWMGKVCRATGGRLSRLWSDRLCSAAATSGVLSQNFKIWGKPRTKKNGGCTSCLIPCPTNGRGIRSSSGVIVRKCPLAAAKHSGWDELLWGKQVGCVAGCWTHLHHGVLCVKVAHLPRAFLYLRGDHATAAGRVKDTFI